MRPAVTNTYVALGFSPDGNMVIPFFRFIKNTRERINEESKIFKDLKTIK
jgi:hypothetical protein